MAPAGFLRRFRGFYPLTVATTKKTDGLEVEERHLDDQIDDALYQYWRDNKRTVLTAAGILIAGVLLFLFVRASGAARQEGAQAAFAEAVASGDSAAFIKKYKGSPAAALLTLPEAADLLEEENFEEAAARYFASEEGLTRTPLQGVGQLGRAITIARSGDTTLAMANLKMILEDDRTLDVVRAIAAYKLGVLGLETNEGSIVETAHSYLDTIPEIGSYYSDRLRLLQKWEPVPLASQVEAPETTPSALPVPEAPELTIPEDAPEAPAVTLPERPTVTLPETPATSEL